MKLKMKRFLIKLAIAGLIAASVATAGTASSARAESAYATPPLLITEMVPDSTNIGSADGYEFIEVYNNTNQPIDFKDYMLIYRYPGKKDEDLYWKPYVDVVIPPQGTMVFWGMTGPNENTPVADFNANYGTNLTENVDIVRIPGGLHNSRDRMVVIATNTGHELVTAGYNNGVDDTNPNMGIKYRYPEPGSTEMIKISGGIEPATPGTVEAGQVPDEPLVVERDSIPPIITDRTAGIHTDLTKPIEIEVQAEDDRLVRTLMLHYKGSEASSYKSVSLRFGADGLYRYAIPLADWVGNRAIDYYFTASDGANETTSGPYQVAILQQDVSPRLNVTDGQFVSGETLLIGSSDEVSPDNLQLKIDGRDVGGTEKALERPAYFVFEASGIDRGVNEITHGRDVLGMIPLNTTSYTTIVIPVERERFRYGEPITIAIRAGSAERSYWEDDPEGGLDDFNVRNVRLMLADGTVIRDPQYSNPSLVLDMGDDGRFLPVVYFHFEIPEAKWTALSYRWNTGTVEDGPHTVELTDPNGGYVAADVWVDNTGPVIETTITDGHTYKGTFTIDAAATDALSGTDLLEVWLDGKAVEVPLTTSSAALEAGEHLLRIRSVDRVGNESIRQIVFQVPEEHPLPPVPVFPEDGAEDVDTEQVTLRVAVEDPTGDPLTVSFYQAERFTSEDAEWRAFTGAADTEPPLQRSTEEEVEMTEEELMRLAASDDLYVVADHVTQFPYHRFQLETGKIGPGDRLEIVWEGHSLKGRRLTMYAWNYRNLEWDSLASIITSSEEDITLRAFVHAKDYVRDGRVDILVQDLIPRRDEYDYTIAWISDTQIYTEVYPEYFESQVHWLRDAAEEMNIKYVVHTGDIVNVTGLEYQWERADRFMNVLEQANIPYGVLAGNHDVGQESDYSHPLDYTMFRKYFGEARFKDRPHYGASYKDNRGHYDLISAGGNDFIFVYMGWGVDDEDIVWMNEVLGQYPQRMAVLALHDYLLPAGTRSAIGEKVFREVVVPNGNVVMVLSGHYTGSALRIDELDDDGDGVTDRTVYQMLNNYQGIESGGLGYLKLLHVDQESGQIYVNTYSPYLDDYNYYDASQDEFTLHLNLEPKRKRVATDFVEVRVFTDDHIGSQAVESGQTAETVWSGLEGGTEYLWYVEVNDQFGGNRVSDIWSFRTVAIIPAPQGLTVTEVTYSSISLAWETAAVEDPQGLLYEVFVNGAPIDIIRETAYTVRNLEPDTEYTFYIVAMNEAGLRSQPSAPVTVSTLINAAAVQRWMDTFAASGELGHPLQKQLANALRQAEHHYNNGRLAQAVKALERFLDHLHNPAMAKHITLEAKEVLHAKASALMNLWDH